MRIIGAYMLAVMGGNEKPDAAAVSAILDAIGEKADEERMKLFFSQIEGKDLAEVIEEGSKKLGAVGGVGGGAPVGGEGEGGEAGEKKEEKKEEEEDDDVGFDSDDDDDE
mmetsp:Transcript_18019/g.34156  ORF Transcript_18019/g.34156 Transcript_18019/m.34156 type:complete len:110 (-) Transcript_18019:133-462(-)|eukprot:CAMPEP_0170167280 /NCGR_PEP_ID=MMETSP0040_2-20121228/733_1 /TAXON_ID=641309 /ORGANISM="Lotharella oceanica, Strain CCMP622" /LENGTH=109 /DNA_ID=CAMNT_0010405259 /DNA_START=53 /DNA_END=382 /DNA_ORIENTATION=+